MQTFLPYSYFQISLESLDTKRLGKQRVEAMQILNILGGKPSRWKNHPAVLMWSGHTFHLSYYHNLSLDIWKSRGYKNNMEYKYVPALLPEPPWFIGFDLFHKAHRSNLFRKKPNHYTQFSWIGPDLPYIWPHATEHRYCIGSTKNGWIQI